MKRFFPAVLLAACVQVAWAAPELELTDLDGRTHTLADYKGKWVVVNYWATWCPPCLEELPDLELFYSNNRERAVVLGINMEDIELQRLRKFVDDQFLSFPILRGTRAAAKAMPGGVPGLPTTYLVAPDGEVVARQVGGVTAREIESFIARHESSSE